MAARIRLRRVYDPDPGDGGPAFLVDRLWPRGVRKADLPMEGWLKDVAPSEELRKWYCHVPELWEEFLERYEQELDGKPETWTPLLEAARRPAGVTLLYAARDTERNNAVALARYLEGRLQDGPRLRSSGAPPQA